MGEEQDSEAILPDPIGELDLNLFILLDTIYRLNSVGLAARHLGMTQSAASRALARLRDFYGDPLFIKTNNKMLPSAKAIELAPSVADIMSKVRETLTPSREFDSYKANKVIALGLSDIAEVILMPALNVILRAEAPNCYVQSYPIADAGLRSAIESGAVNIIVSNSVPPIGDLMQQSLFKDKFSVIAHPDAAMSRTISLQDYAAAEHVVYLPPMMSPVLDESLLRYGIKRKLRYRTRSMLALPELVTVDRSLIATVPSGLAQRYADRGLVKVLEPAFELPEVQVYQFWHRRYDNEPFNVWLRSRVREAVARVAKEAAERGN